MEKKYFKKKSSHSKEEVSKTPDSQQKTNKQTKILKIAGAGEVALKIKTSKNQD